MNSGPSKRVKNNLVALGSAAVLTVYAAGYLRTRPAAQRFATEDAERPPAAPTAARPAVPPATPSIAAPVASGPAAVGPAGARAVPRVSNSPGAGPAAQSVRSTDSSPMANAEAPTTSALPPTPTAGSPVVAPAEQPAIDASRASANTPAADSAAPAKDRARVQLKDGLYSGWGTSRHGDIQASVQVDSGRIVAAWIEQCLTRYSCSWIAHLPNQVIARQNANVDYVSGATQSVNAFYHAVLEALSKAK